MIDKQEVVFLSNEESLKLVERIAKIVAYFGYSMSGSEKEAMSSLLSATGVRIVDIIDVANMANNYAINAEIVGPDEVEYYSNLDEDSLFSWTDNGDRYYCYQW